MRTKITTTIEESILQRAKKYAKTQGYDGVNVLIEKALKLYFENSGSQVWEKTLASGWLKKLVIQGDSILYENIKCRKTLNSFSEEDYSEEALSLKGWKKSK